MLVFQIVVLEANDGSGDPALVAGPDRILGSPVFQCMENAESFLEKSQMKSQLSARRLVSTPAVAWLKSLRQRGIEFVVQEPAVTPVADADEFIRVESFLARYCFAR